MKNVCICFYNSMMMFIYDFFFFVLTKQLIYLEVAVYSPSGKNRQKKTV